MSSPPQRSTADDDPCHTVPYSPDHPRPVARLGPAAHRFEPCQRPAPDDQPRPRCHGEFRPARGLRLHARRHRRHRALHDLPATVRRPLCLDRISPGLRPRLRPRRTQRDTAALRHCPGSPGCGLRLHQAGSPANCRRPRRTRRHTVRPGDHRTACGHRPGIRPAARWSAGGRRRLAHPLPRQRPARRPRPDPRPRRAADDPGSPDAAGPRPGAAWRPRHGRSALGCQCGRHAACRIHSPHCGGRHRGHRRVLCGGPALDHSPARPLPCSTCPSTADCLSPP